MWLKLTCPADLRDTLASYKPINRRSTACAATVVAELHA